MTHPGLILPCLPVPLSCPCSYVQPWQGSAWRLCCLALMLHALSLSNMRAEDWATDRLGHRLRPRACVRLLVDRTLES